MLKMTLKFLLAISLTTWLLTNGKLDFSLISESFGMGHLWIFGFLALASRLFIASLRSKVLLDTKTAQAVSFKKVLSFDAIGNLFSVILPGASAGDVINFFYFKNLSADISASTIATIIFLDRLIGLFALMFMAIVLGAIKWQSLIQLNANLISLILISGGLLIASGLFILFFFSRAIDQKKYSSFLSILLRKWPKAQHSLHDMLSIKLSLKPFIICFNLSLLNHLMVVLGFWAFASPFLPNEASLIPFFSIIPLGMLGSSLPITPAGLGVGHVLFDHLFQMIHIQNGASLFNLYFIGNTLVNLLGIIPYFLVKSELTKK